MLGEQQRAILLNIDLARVTAVSFLLKVRQI